MWGLPATLLAASRYTRRPPKPRETGVETAFSVGAVLRSPSTAWTDSPSGPGLDSFSATRQAYT